MTAPEEMACQQCHKPLNTLGGTYIHPPGYDDGHAPVPVPAVELDTIARRCGLTRTEVAAKLNVQTRRTQAQASGLVFSPPRPGLLLQRAAWPRTHQDQRKQESQCTERGLRTPYEHHRAEGWQPRYVFTPRLVGRLAVGELAVEPVLGPVRVAGVKQPEAGPGGSHVFVSWRDERGPGTATGRYPAGRSFIVHMPAHEDRLLVRRGIDQAKWHGREITDDTARLIAGHLYPGERSALHRFIIDGSVDEQLYDELETVAQHRHYAREWVDTLARYCLSREDTGPIAEWTRQARRIAEARTEEWLSAAGIRVEALQGHVKTSGNGKHTQADRRRQYRDLLSRKTMQTETAVQLIEAAFIQGLEAGRSRARAPGVRRYPTRRRARRTRSW